MLIKSSSDKMDEELEKSNEERRKIVLKYKLGRENNDINEWEDPDFGLHFKVDRYGFIHSENLPSKLDVNEERHIETELQREIKWLKMIKHWHKKENSEKLNKRIFKGIPNKLRSSVWAKLFNLEKIMKENKDVYAKMLTLAQKYSTDIRQIDSDVNRQFRDHVSFRERYNIKQQQLFNVLAAYSMYNMEVGYCQGMSTLAGCLLIYLDEEESFWALNVLLTDKKFAMHGLYIEGFPKLMRFLAHHDRILTKFLPKLKKHFDRHNLDAVLYSLKWFFVIFIERIPFRLCLRVLDIYFLQGERVATAMAYTILKLHRDKLLKFKDMDLITEYLQYKLQKSFGYSDNFVIKSLEQSLTDLKSAKLDLPPPATDAEYPKFPMGKYIEPTIEKKLGLRKSRFTETEKNVTEYVITRNDANEEDDENGNDEENLENLNADCTLSIRTYKSMNSLYTLNTGTSIATSTDSIGFEVNQYEIEDVSEDEVTRL
ncbi:unnamed protein product [Diamesa hyperborea]